MRKTFYGWWVTLAAFLTFGIAVGLPYYNMPFFYDYFQREFHWTKGQITFGFPLAALLDRKSTRLNSSHLGISYAVFCLKKIVVNAQAGFLFDGLPLLFEVVLGYLPR